MTLIRNIFIIVLILSLSSHLMAEQPSAVSRTQAEIDAKGIDPVEITQPVIDEYQSRITLFYLMTDDYISLLRQSNDSFATAKERQEMSLFLRLLSERIQEEGPVHQSTGAQPKIAVSFNTWLLDALNSIKGYDELLSISQNLDAEGRIYYEGISLMRMNRIEESKKALARVPFSNNFYPYARIALAQISVMRQNLNDAEESLRELLTHASVSDSSLAEKVYLMLGQVLFERGRYADAAGEFMRIQPGSNLAREASVGRAWCLIKLGEFDKAIPVLKEISLAFPYDSVELDVLKVLGYCYQRAGMTQQALEFYEGLLTDIEQEEKRLDLIINDKTVRHRYLSSLIKNDDSLLSEGEQYYLTAMRTDSSVASILNEARLLYKLMMGFSEMQKDLRDKEIYISNAIKGLEDYSKKIKDINSRIKGTLIGLDKQYEAKDRSLSFEDKEKQAKRLGDVTAVMFNYWKEALGHEVSQEIRYMARLIMEEWFDERRIGCKQQDIVCHILSFFARTVARKQLETPEQVKEWLNMLDMIGKDMTMAANDKKTRFEDVIYEAGIKAARKIKQEQDTLVRLKEIRERLKTAEEESREGNEEIIASLDTSIIGRMAKTKYDIGEFKVSVSSNMDNIRQTIKKQGMTP